MKKLLATTLAAVAIAVGLTSPAQAAKVGTCEDEPKINLRLCASVGWADGTVWASGQGRELVGTASRQYEVTVALYRQPCAGGAWTAIGRSVTQGGHDRIQVITPAYRLQQGYVYAAWIIGSDGRTGASHGGDARRYTCG